MGVSNKAMLVLAADCKSVPEEASCSIQHTPTILRVSSQKVKAQATACLGFDSLSSYVDRNEFGTLLVRLQPYTPILLLTV